MSKALWFSIAILLCSALAVEALTCIKCKNFKQITSRCISANPSKMCFAKPGKQCHIIKYFAAEEMKIVYSQGCGKPKIPCNTTGSLKEGTMLESICCDHHDFCNTP